MGDISFQSWLNLRDALEDNLGIVVQANGLARIPSGYKVIYNKSAGAIPPVPDPKYNVTRSYPEVVKNNSYNHPKEVTLKKLEDLGTKIYRTDEDGTIILTSDGENMSFETVKTDTNGG